jgi:hypothetical protein
MIRTIEPMRRVFGAAALLGYAIFVACSLPVYEFAPPPPPPPFDLAVSPPILILDSTVGKGTGAIDVTLVRTEGFTGTVGIHLSAPPNSPFTFLADSTLEGSASKVSLSIQASAMPPPGSTVWNLAVKATSGDFSLERVVSVRIGRLLCKFSGATQTTCPIPDGVTRVTIAAWGAGGGSGGAPSPNAGAATGSGGTGGFIEGDLAVTPNQILNVLVGGGGMGGPLGNGSQGSGGGGGGVSAISVGDAQVLVAGAGGGGGGSYAGGFTLPGYGGGAAGLGTGNGSDGQCGFGCAGGGQASAGGAAGLPGCNVGAGTAGAHLAGGANSGGGGGGLGGGGAGGAPVITSGGGWTYVAQGGGGGGSGWFGGGSGAVGCYEYHTSGSTATWYASGGGGGSGHSELDASRAAPSTDTLTHCKCMGLVNGGPSVGGGAGNSGEAGRVIVYVSQ